ncbi:MAG: ATP-dependent Clp protease proteolytic subunit [Clostridiales bacterium]|nr:ATP-dependent Clp protease proteolytic subunit [Clostridiales bacterium]
MIKCKEDFSLDYSLKRNTVNIFGVIDDVMAELVISQLQYLDDNGAEEITIQINSPGGSVSAGLAIYDTMNFIKARIVTVGIGRAASMGAFLLSAGSRGYRRATENCDILIHQPLGGAQGQASDIIIAANHIERMRKRLNTILSENTGKSIRQINIDTDRDKSMTAQEALEYGLIDTVIPCKNKAKKQLDKEV